MRQKVMVPTKGSSMILNASNDKGSLSSALRTTSLPSSSVPLIAGPSSGDGVEQRLHALVLERRAAQHRIERTGQHGLTDQPLQRRLVWLLAVEIRSHSVVVELDGGLDHLLAIFLGLIDQVRRNVDIVEFRTEGFIVPDDALHEHEIDETLEIVLGTDRKLDRDRLGAEAIDDIGQALEE